MWGPLRNKRLERWNDVFLASTTATSASGFLFPVDHVTPGQIIGILSLLLLAAAVIARQHQQLAGRWRTTYIISAVTAQYLNFFVLVVQLFLKVPALKALAPTLTEPVFAITQLVTLAAFLGAGLAAVVRFRGERSSGALPNRFAQGESLAVPG
jgi:hypothetical protein